MTTVALDIPTFRKTFAEFNDEERAPDEVITFRWTQATGYIDADDTCSQLQGTTRQLALHCLTAHLMRLDKMAAQPGGLTGVVQAATIDKVQVQLVPPPVSGEWGHWLAQTPYGQQLAALLSQQAAGGFYVGGNPERAAFRKVGGWF